MIDAIKTLLNKTSELEERVDELSSKQTSFSNQSNFVCFSKGMINSTFLNSNKLLLAEFQTTENKSLYFQNQIELNVPTSQNIKLTLIINNIAIYRSTRKLQAGYNQITIMKSYIPLESENVELYLQITSEDNSMITIITDTLLIWGLHENLSNIHYDAIETKDKYLLSYLSNNLLFYSFVDKNETALNSEDFSYFGNANSYSFVYHEDDDVLYIFRIDLNGNLFYSDFNNYNENFIDSNVSHVSATANGKEIIVSLIKNNKCYICEIDEQKNISSLSHINCNNIPIVKSYIYQNKVNGKHYLIMIDKLNSNYITQSIAETKLEHNYLNATYSITYSTYEANV